MYTYSMGDGDSSKLGAVAEAVVNPVIDEVGKALEIGAQSITGTGQMATLNPQEEAKRKQEEEIKKRNIKVFLNQFKTDQAGFNQQKQSDEQKKLQEQDAKKQQVQQIKVFEKEKKEKSIVEQTGKGRAEIKKGIGG